MTGECWVPVGKDTWEDSIYIGNNVKFTGKSNLDYNGDKMPAVGLCSKVLVVKGVIEKDGSGNVVIKSGSNVLYKDNSQSVSSSEQAMVNKGLDVYIRNHHDNLDEDCFKPVRDCPSSIVDKFYWKETPSTYSVNVGST